MSRLRARSHTNAVSLFPFLDVLLSTMGSLILLFIIVSRATRARALDSLHDPGSVVVTQDLEAERELLELRISQLTEQRARTQQDLRDRQLELGHLEQDAQKLRAQLDELVRSAGQLQSSHALSIKERSDLEFALSRRKAQIARKRLELDELRRMLASQAPSYAIIPYMGPNGTRRPPIYIECLADSIVIQPEGIVLTGSDFQGPLGPGNPLAAGIRAAREHLVRKRAEAVADAELVEPYPLLLVRPEGIEAYWVAREALQSWGADFGYELIDADWELAFGEADAELADLVQQAVDSAREQQQLLAELAPRSFGHAPRVYRANPGGGGIIAEDGSQYDEHGHSRSGRGRGRGELAARAGQGPAGRALRGTNGAADGPYPPERPLGGGSAGGGRGGAQGGLAGHEGASSGSATSGGQAGSDTAGERRATAGGGASRGQQAGWLAQASGGGFGPSGTSGASGTPSGSAAPAGQSALDTAGRASGQRAQMSSGGSGTIDYTAAPRIRSLAEKRGKNWGIPDAARGASAVTRPIVLECRHDSLALLSDDGLRRETCVISLSDNTEDAVDPLIAAMWKQIESWGIAGNAMYWHPFLVLEVQPRGERRAAELEALLADSGIEVKRRESQATSGSPAGNRRR